ncbi:MAG TPA: circularly permuted type 2 ATP-grasp protein, partial [Fibrobacteria bacterium]|nr:circularly permuted type 2 ATP-grasp protein [Fibrobacteria bacterium]
MNPELADKPGPINGLLQHYRPAPGGWDEMVVRGGAVRLSWAGLATTLDELGSEDVRRRKQALAEQLRLNGVTYNVYGDSQGADRIWSLDPIPLILESAEWEEVERGLNQRAELLDAILRDVYGPRKLVREGLLPALFLYSHPGFQRACSGNPSVQQRMLRFYSADMVRGEDGGFRVVSDRGQNPSGYGYALENRSVLSRTLPSLFRQSGVHRLDGFFQSFRKSLVEAAPPGVRDPFIVLMSPGPENETYFEQAYLASYLGLPLVRGSDLTPRDGGIQLLSLDGPRRVDVILRRVDDTFCDPLELNGSSLLGVPGLLQAVRNRKVAVCNALGSGILGGSGLMSFLPAICKHLFGQDLEMPSVETYWCGDKAQRDMALDRFDDMVIKPLYQGPKRSTWFVNKLTREQREKLLIRIRSKPQLYLAQESLRPSTAPCFIADRLEARSLMLRSFLTAFGGSYSVMPGGLTRVTSRPESIEVT